MTHIWDDNWQQHNQRCLVAALEAVRAALHQHIARVEGTGDAVDAPEELPPPENGTAPTALETLCATFGLSPFERDIVVLCAGVELDADFAVLCANAQGNPQLTAPTFSLALAALSGAYWSAITPEAPLRHWRLITIGDGSLVTQSPLRIDERVLHYLAGVSQLDQRLIEIMAPVPPAGALVPSHVALAQQIAAAWARADQHEALPLMQLCGDDRVVQQEVAAAACAHLGWQLHSVSIDAFALPVPDVTRLLEREIALNSTALLFDCATLDPSDHARVGALTRLFEHIRGPVFVATTERRAPLQRRTTTFDVGKPPVAEQHHAWQQALGSAVQHLNGHVDLLVGQFNLSAQAIRDASAAALVAASLDADESAATDMYTHLWNACRAQARPRLDDLAQRIESGATWDDLVLPATQQSVLRTIAAHVRQRATVYERWGFAGKGGRGLGISALFAGVSGTGKTLSAEVIANELRLDLYKIDLSSVVSKYIGETEKNLRRIFDAAEAGGAILLFDEADALFGKRSEVRDSHDRYANIEVSYLLQRMEAYRGLAILTTNLKSAIDTAFMRRIRFVVQYPFPDAAQRAEMWQRIFPPATPTDSLDPLKLARLNVAGGNIRNIALNAAFLAADENAPVRMAHLLRAARGEYAKLEKAITEAEIAGWM